MREIKFRGKRVDNGEWVYGWYIRYEHMGVIKHFIVTNWAQIYVNSFEVDPETVGQYTGLKDINGTDIYEGDMLHDQRFDSGIGNVYYDTELAVWKVGFPQEDWLYEFHDCSKVIGYCRDLLGEVRE